MRVPTWYYIFFVIQHVLFFIFFFFFCCIESTFEISAGAAAAESYIAPSMENRQQANWKPPSTLLSFISVFFSHHTMQSRGICGPRCIHYLFIFYYCEAAQQQQSSSESYFGGCQDLAPVRRWVVAGVISQKFRQTMIHIYMERGSNVRV